MFEESSLPFRHQLLVSTSKHYYVGADGQLRYQKKAIEPKLFRDPDRVVVHRLMIDAASGVVYAESASKAGAHPFTEFLKRAWGDKKTGKPGIDQAVARHLYGPPDELLVPQTVWDDPDVRDVLTQVEGLAFLKPPSGFAAGIRSVKTWEENVVARFLINNAAIDQLDSGAWIHGSFMVNCIGDKAWAKPQRMGFPRRPLPATWGP